MYRRQALILRFAVALVAMAALMCFSAKTSRAQENPGAVYVLTNQASNSVMVYARATDGALSFSGSFSTGGRGMGSGPDPLASQGSLVLGRWGRLLFAVNAGSNDISVFSVQNQGLQLQLLDREPSGGAMPVSIAVYGDLVYVLNAGNSATAFGAPDIQGFIMDPSSGRLTQLPGSRRFLPGGPASAAAEVAFSPDGDVLMVTEKGTNKIDTWSVSDDGSPENGRSINSNGAVPFGFAFIRREYAVVSEAMASALSSYNADYDGTLQLVTGSLGDTQAANCWVVTTKSGHYAFTTNSGSGTISSYQISQDGTLSLLNAVAANTGGGTAPIDMALSTDSQFLYVRDGLNGILDGFQVGSDGSLTPIGSANGVPANAQGIAAR
jgi:6-phosphogluconolactonase (cycloisomerase 2 family)